MKGKAVYKTIQLILLLLLAGACIWLIFGHANVFRQVAQDDNMKILCGALWVVFILSFVFIYIDFRFFLKYRKEYREMSMAVTTDPTTGIGNRHSADIEIGKYMKQQIPPDIACIMIDLTNIADINKNYGHEAGDIVLSDFSSILRTAAPKDSFLARNGGTRFMIIINPCTQLEIDTFVAALSVAVSVHNSSSGAYAIAYRAGYAFHENESVRNIADMVSLATNRINQY